MRYEIVSADSHLDLFYLPPDTFTSRAPARLRDRVPKVVTTDQGPSWIGDGGFLGLYGGWMGLKGMPGYRGKKMEEAGFDPQECRPANPALRLEDQDKDGIDAEVIYGVRFVEDTIKDPAVVTATFQAYNDFITEFCEPNRERLLGIGVIPAHSPEAAAQELKRIGRNGLGLRGALFDWFNAPQSIWHHMWEPMWAAAEDAGVALSFHIGFGHGTTTVGPGPDNRSQASKDDPVSIAAHSAVVAMQADEALASILVCGALERHPGLKVVMAESHIGWVPYVLDRMDRKFEEGDYKQWLKTRPSDLFRRQAWATFQDDRAGCLLAKEYAPDSFCWASDYPHMDGTWPESRRFIQETMGGLDALLRARLICRNVMRIYDLTEDR